MAKGKASQNSLKALAHPLQEFIQTWGGLNTPRKSQPNLHSASLPAPYALAALRGEGILRLRFFNEFIQKTNISFNDAQTIELWQTLVEQGGYISAWVQRLNVAKALKREAILPSDATSEHRALFCILLDALNAQAPHLLPWAIEGYFMHCYKAQFPSTPQTKSKAVNAIQLRENLTREFRTKLRENIQLKESFQTVATESINEKADSPQQTTQIQFGLMLKRSKQSPWHNIITLTRPKLKTARLATYETALKNIDDICASLNNPPSK